MIAAKHRWPQAKGARHGDELPLWARATKGCCHVGRSHFGASTLRETETKKDRGGGGGGRGRKKREEEEEGKEKEKRIMREEREKDK